MYHRVRYRVLHSVNQVYNLSKHCSVVRRSCSIKSALSFPAINICHSSKIIEDAHKVTRPRNITRVILTLMTSDVR
jgi:hypothetical protein